jgi:hypothetical protein
MSLIPQRHALRSIAATILAGLLLMMVDIAAAFDQGRTSASLLISPGQQLDRNYTVLGGRFGHYFVRDFEASVAIEAWRGNDPAIYKIVPELRYVYSRAGAAKPYGGIFISRALYSGLPDRYTYGAKGGVYFTLNASAHLGLGITYERIEACDSRTYIKCRQLYPELGLHFVF